MSSSNVGPIQDACRMCHERPRRTVPAEEAEARNNGEVEDFFHESTVPPVDLCHVCVDLLQGCVRMACLKCAKPESAHVDADMEFEDNDDDDFDESDEEFPFPYGPCSFNWCKECRGGDDDPARNSTVDQVKADSWKRHRYLVFELCRRKSAMYESPNFATADPEHYASCASYLRTAKKASEVIGTYDVMFMHSEKLSFRYGGRDAGHEEPERLQKRSVHGILHIWKEHMGRPYQAIRGTINIDHQECMLASKFWFNAASALSEEDQPFDSNPIRAGIFQDKDDSMWSGSYSWNMGLHFFTKEFNLQWRPWDNFESSSAEYVEELHAELTNLRSGVTTASWITNHTPLPTSIAKLIQSFCVYCPEPSLLILPEDILVTLSFHHEDCIFNAGIVARKRVMNVPTDDRKRKAQGAIDI